MVPVPRQSLTLRFKSCRTVLFCAINLWVEIPYIGTAPPLSIDNIDILLLSSLLNKLNNANSILESTQSIPDGCALWFCIIRNRNSVWDLYFVIIQVSDVRPLSTHKHHILRVTHKCAAGGFIHQSFSSKLICDSVSILIGDEQITSNTW
jgi:hypothetical protein